MSDSYFGRRTDIIARLGELRRRLGGTSGGAFPEQRAWELGHPLSAGEYQTVKNQILALKRELQALP
jgi:hypothetical protein